MRARGGYDMQFVFIGVALFVAYQAGLLTPLGLSSSSSLIQSNTQSLSNQISAREQASFGATPNQPNVPNSTLSAVSSFASSGLGGLISSIFGGMRLRAQQATIENQALNYAVQAFDQSLAKVNAAYLNGQINAHDAITLLQQIYSQYWSVTASKIQPNRNGCANGSNCPGTAMQYEATNGAPAGYCANGIGATCCVGCGPIRLGIERSIAVLQQGGGASSVPTIVGDHYGLQTRLGYQVSWGRA